MNWDEALHTRLIGPQLYYNLICVGMTNDNHPFCREDTYALDFVDSDMVVLAADGP